MASYQSLPPVAYQDHCIAVWPLAEVKSKAAVLKRPAVQLLASQQEPVPEATDPVKVQVMELVSTLLELMDEQLLVMGSPEQVSDAHSLAVPDWPSIVKSTGGLHSDPAAS